MPSPEVEPKQNGVPLRKNLLRIFEFSNGEEERNKLQMPTAAKSFYFNLKFSCFGRKSEDIKTVEISLEGNFKCRAEGFARENLLSSAATAAFSLQNENFFTTLKFIWPVRDCLILLFFYSPISLSSRFFFPNSGQKPKCFH